MTVTALTPIYPVASGVNAALAAANAGGNSVPNDGRIFIRLKNGGGVDPCVVTFVTTQTVGGLAVAEQVVSVPIGAERLFGPFPPSLYGRTLNITYDQVVSVTVGAESCTPDPN